METQLWGIAIKGDNSESELKAKVKELADVSKFRVPATALRVGTLDSLMSLSDELSKMDTLAETTVTKMYKQLTDLKPDEETCIIGVPVRQYTTMQWEWDDAKFQTKAPLRDLCETISLRMASLDDELKVKVTEMNVLKGALQSSERKMQGNLMVRGLADIIKKDQVMESDYMTTMWCVVPKASMKDFEDTYEKMATYVVPKSGLLLSEDSEYSLYRVIIFKKSLDQFKTAAREKRLTLREFTWSDGAKEAEAAKKLTDGAELGRLKTLLGNWCQVNYAEAYIMMLHLKAVRVFVESVLRYGLTESYDHLGSRMTPNFKSFFLHPKKGKTEALRKELSSMYGGAGGFMEGEDESVVPGATGEFYPYVYNAIETEPILAA